MSIVCHILDKLNTVKLRIGESVMGGIRVIKIRGEKRFDSNIALVSYVGGDLEVLLGQFN